MFFWDVPMQLPFNSPRLQTNPRHLFWLRIHRIVGRKLIVMAAMEETATFKENGELRNDKLLIINNRRVK